MGVPVKTSSGSPGPQDLTGRYLDPGMELHRILLVLLASSFTAPPTVAYNTLYGYTQAELAAFIDGTELGFKVEELVIDGDTCQCRVPESSSSSSSSSSSQSCLFDSSSSSSSPFESSSSSSSPFESSSSSVPCSPTSPSCAKSPYSGSSSSITTTIGATSATSAATTQTNAPTTQLLTNAPTTQMLTNAPTTQMLTNAPTTQMLTNAPTTQMLTNAPTTQMLTNAPTTQMLTNPPTTQMNTVAVTTAFGGGGGAVIGSVLNVGSGAGANAGGGLTGTGTSSDPKYVCWDSYFLARQRVNIETAYSNGAKEIYLKSHPQYGFLNYLANQDCYVSVRVWNGGMAGRSLKLEVLDGQLEGSSFLSIRENGHFSAGYTQSLTGRTYVQPVRQFYEDKDTITFRFKSGGSPGDLGQGFLIKVSEI